MGRHAGFEFGEGFTVEILEDNSAVVYWFSFDTAGNRRWFFASDSQSVV